MPIAKCRICKSPFEKRSMSHVACGAECAESVSIAKREKEARKQAKKERERDRARLIDLKPLSYWEKRAETACNTYIRERDSHLPCISCGATSSYPRWQAGHYVSVGGNSTLRYNEDNIHKQCVHCNMHKGGNVIKYRQCLINKIGEDRVEWLEGWHAPVKRTREELQEIEAMYKRKLKEL